MLQHTLPEGVNRLAHVVYVDARDVFVEQQFERDSRPACVGLDILPVQEVVVFHQALDVQGQFGLSAGVAQRGEVDEALLAGFAHNQIVSKNLCALSHPVTRLPSVG
jgi:hypothetical protein